MHSFMCLVSLFTIGLLPLEIFKMPYLPYYFIDFDQIKKSLNSLKAFSQYNEYKWYKFKLRNEKS